MPENNGNVVVHTFDTKPDKDATVGKSLTMRADFGRMTRDMLTAHALKAVVIKVQDAVRKNWTAYNAETVIDVDVADLWAGKTIRVPTVASVKADFATMPEEKRLKVLHEIAEAHGLSLEEVLEKKEE